MLFYVKISLLVSHTYSNCFILVRVMDGETVLGMLGVR